MNVLERVWEHSLAVLKKNELIKWDFDKKSSEYEKTRAQGIVDALRAVLLKIREDEEFARVHKEEWQEVSTGAVTTHRLEEHKLCPIDRSIMKFSFQNSQRQRYVCEAEKHVWDYDWRELWDAEFQRD